MKYMGKQRRNVVIISGRIIPGRAVVTAPLKKREKPKEVLETKVSAYRTRPQTRRPPIIARMRLR